MKACRGFTLMESLVALVVLSLGLLGAALMITHSLGYLRQAAHQVSATALVADMVERIRVDPAALVASELDRFALDARTALPHRNAQVAVTFEPAIGPATPGRYLVTLRWHEAPGADADEVTFVLLAQSPVAGPA
jgi:type IV pilus assembly protein PilV